MGISVIPTAALPGNAASDNSSSALPGLDAGAIDFAALLAGQLGDFSQMLNAMSNGAASTNARDRQIGTGNEDQDAALLGTIALCGLRCAFGPRANWASFGGAIPLALLAAFGLFGYSYELRDEHTILILIALVAGRPIREPALQPWG